MIPSCKVRHNAPSPLKATQRYTANGSSADFDLLMGDLWPRDARRKERIEVGDDFDRNELSITKIDPVTTNPDSVWRTSGGEWKYTLEAPWAVAQTGKGYLVFGQLQYGDQLFSLRWAPFDKSYSMNGRLWFDIIQYNAGNTSSQLDISDLIAGYTTSNLEEPSQTPETLKIRLKIDANAYSNGLMKIQASAENISGISNDFSTFIAPNQIGTSSSEMRFKFGVYRRRKCVRFWEPVKVRISDVKIDQQNGTFPAAPNYSSGL